MYGKLTNFSNRNILYGVAEGEQITTLCRVNITWNFVQLILNLNFKL